jgi:hypothetical protein
MTLDTRPRLADADALYALLVEAHRGLSAEESRKLDAKLVLILANHIGEMDTLRAAIDLARGATAPDPG